MGWLAHAKKSGLRAAFLEGGKLPECYFLCSSFSLIRADLPERSRKK